MPLGVPIQRCGVQVGDFGAVFRLQVPLQQNPHSQIGLISFTMFLLLPCAGNTACSSVLVSRGFLSGFTCCCITTNQGNKMRLHGTGVTTDVWRFLPSSR